MRSLALEIIEFADESSGATRKLILGDADLGGTNIDPLDSFCGAEPKLVSIQARIKGMLDSPHLPTVQRRHLGDMLAPIEGELLPAVRKLRETLLRTARGFCPGDPSD